MRVKPNRALEPTDMSLLATCDRPCADGSAPERSAVKHRSERDTRKAANSLLPRQARRHERLASVALEPLGVRVAPDKDRNAARLVSIAGATDGWHR
jgi:hypothetical protein